VPVFAVGVSDLYKTYDLGTLSLRRKLQKSTGIALPVFHGLYGIEYNEYIHLFHSPLYYRNITILFFLNTIILISTIRYSHPLPNTHQSINWWTNMYSQCIWCW